jgi:hypothetical protein
VTALPPLSPEIGAAVAAVAIGAALLALVVAVVALRRARNVDGRLQRLEEHYALVMRGVEGQDLAAALEAGARRLGAGERRIEALERRAGELDGRVRRAVTGLKLLRYRAFEDAGGDQSFAVALLDEDGNGAVLSGIHGRGGVRIYGKPVADGTSSYNLTNEEAQAIAEARGEAVG